MQGITREQLYQYIFLRREVDNQLERMIRMRNDALIPAVKKGIGAQHSAGDRHDCVANAIHRRMAYEESIAEDLERKLQVLEAVERAVNMLKDPQEREVLRLRYIDCADYRHTAWRVIAIKLYRSDDESRLRAIHRIHKRALDHLEGRT